jgi:hypothetical protein
MLLRWYWTPRSEGFYTLGRAAYKDICMSNNRKSTYYDKVSASNNILRTHFSDLYERVRKAVSDHVAEPATFSPELALPGFHLFFGEAIFRASMEPFHIDHQHEQLELPRLAKPVSLLSYTLPIALPTGGSGLEILERDSNNTKYLPYNIGQMLLHDGCIEHRIAVKSQPTKWDSRITLQGHAVRSESGTWLMYW